MLNHYRLQAFVLFLILFCYSNQAQTRWVQEKDISSSFDLSIPHIVEYKDSLNYIVVLEGVGGIHTSQIFIDGIRDTVLEVKLDVFLENSPSEMPQVFSDFTLRRYVIYNGRKFALLTPSNQTLTEYNGNIYFGGGDVREALRKWDGPFGDRRLIGYQSSSNAAVQTILTITPNQTELAIDTLLKVYNPQEFGRVRSFDIDPLTNSIIVFSVNSEEAFLKQRVGIYNSLELVDSFDFTLPLYIENYGFNSSTSIEIAGVHSIGNNRWMMSMKEGGYYISVDNAKSWQYVEINDEYGFNNSALYQTPDGKFVYAAGRGEKFLFKSSDDAVTVNDDIDFYDVSLLKIPNPQPFNAYDNIYSTPFQMNTYDNATGWIYYLDTKFSSVAIDNLQVEGQISLKELIETEPTSKVYLYNLAGKMIENFEAKDFYKSISYYSGTTLIVISNSSSYKIIVP